MPPTVHASGKSWGASMSEPLWRQIAVECVQSLLTAHRGEVDAADFVRLFRRLVESLAALAADPSVPAEERSAAQAILDKLTARANAEPGETIASMVGLAADRKLS